MILVWKNIESFRRHLEDMRSFRQSHEDPKASGLNWLKDATVPLDVVRSEDASPSKIIIDNNGKPLLMPMWQINLDKGAQN